MPDIAFPRPRLLQTLAARLLWGAVLVASWGVGQSLADDQADPPAAPGSAPAVDFVRDIKPIFVAHCYECHGPGEERGGLSLAQHALALSGGDTAPAFVPGSADASLIVKRVTGGQPPAMPLDREPLSDAQNDLLKKWIDQGAVWPVSADEADPRHRAAADHWAFRPLVKPPLPAAALAESEATQAEPSPSEVIDRFVIAGLEAAGLQMQPEADRITLLRRATFDLTGLAPPPETILPFAADPRPEAYEELIEQLLASPAYGERWARHWLDVVRYSDSGGYDTDILYEQAWRYRQYCIRSFQDDKPFDRFLEEQVAGDELWPEQAEAMADAVAVWTLGQWPNAFDAFPDKLAYVRRNDQVVTLSEAMLGLSVGCANCHHHKYDPLSQRDYFGLEAVFAGSESFNRTTGNIAWVNGEKSHYRALRHAAEPVSVHLLRRGELSQPAGRIVPAAPAFLPHGGPLFPPGEENPAQARARLAKWITSPDHPLTARVIANRVWQWHFGRGIVATPNDFGTQGAAPSHRELLDWLAADLRDRGYHLKDLHRAIMHSRTYRQSSQRESAAVAKDPENILLAGFPRRRMEAEAVWDRLLEASGRLDRRPVDEPFVPPLTDEELQGLYDLNGNPRENKWKATEAQNRRAIYMLNRRSFRMPLLEAFDQPPNSVGCPVRPSTTVPGQSLAMLNGDIPVEQATALRDRLYREEPVSIERRLNRAWLLVFARPIRADELASARKFLLAPPETPTADVWIELCLALFNANEFVYVD